MKLETNLETIRCDMSNFLLSPIPQRVPVLVYHRVYSDDDLKIPVVHPGEYCGHVIQSEFKRQMDYLVQYKFRTITHDQLGKWLYAEDDLPERVVAIDFDDNRLNVLENAFPIMQERSLVGTVFVITELASGRLPFGTNDFPAMSWKDLAKLQEAGWCIGSHTKSHPLFTYVQTKAKRKTEILDELHGSQEEIEHRLGVLVEHFAYPGGSWNKRVEQLVKRFYRTARLWRENSPWKYTTRKTYPYRLEAINISARMSFQEFRRIIEGALNR